jgi:hypothetical protein
MSKIFLTPKDNATSLLTAGISAVATSIPITAASGALFPQPYNGSCTSGGSATALNCTGISAAIGGSAAQGKFIYNATDGSWCKIVTVNTNALVTTRLNDGATNLWNNSDKWYIDPFIATLAVVSTNAYGVKTVTASEKVLIIARSTDTLTVATGGRGYDGSTAQTFSLGDSFFLNVNQLTIANIQEIALSLQTQVDTNLTTLNTANTNITNLQTGAFNSGTTTGSANAYVLTPSPALAAYVQGNTYEFKANFTNTGACTINISGLGAKSIKKMDHATALTANDIISGQTVSIVYDGTNFAMTSPVGQVASSPWTNILSTFTVSTDTIASTTAEVTISNATVAITGNTLAVGDTYEFIFRGYASHVNGSSLQFRPYFGAAVMGPFNLNTNSGSPTQGAWEVKGYAQVVAIGAGGTVMLWAQASRGKGAGTDMEAAARIIMTQANQAPTAVDTTATVTVKLTCQTDTSNAGSYCRCIQATVRKLLV